MKTSNKLLIIFMLLMFIIPLAIMAYTINRDYKNPNEIKAQENANAHFNIPSIGFTSIGLKKAFKSINVVDEKDKFWYINLVNDISYGVKVSEAYKDFVLINVDESGKLRITLKGDTKKVIYPIVLYVYSPKIEELNLDGVDAVTLKFKNYKDKLQLNVKDVSQLNLREDFRVSDLSIHAERVNDLVLAGEEIKLLNLDLKSSYFRSEMRSFASLNISASDGSRLNFSGNDRQANEFSIDSLILNTSGKVDVDLANIKLNNISGSLSNETMINVPVGYLKQMIK